MTAPEPRERPDGEKLEFKPLLIDDNGNEEVESTEDCFLSSPSQPSSGLSKYALLKGFLICILFFCLVVYRFSLLKISPGDETREETLQWRELQELICPNQTPQFIEEKIGPFLFYKAQQVLGIDTSHHVVAETRFKRYMSYVWGSPYADIRETILERNNLIDGEGVPGNGTSDIGETLSLQRLLYVPIWKCSHRSISHWQSQLTDPPNNLTFRHWSQLEAEENLQKLPQNKTCAVTLIRDAVSHFLSGYNEIAGRVSNRNFSFSYDEVPFHRIDNLEDRFKVFVRQYVQGMLWHTNFDDMHVHPMMKVLAWTSANGYPANQVLYLPQMTNLSHDWPAFVDEACSKHFGGDYDFNFTQTTYQRVQDTDHKSSSDPLGTYASAKKVFYEEQGPVAKALCYLHMPDYACWRNLPDGVPPLCMQVYADPDFTRELKNV